MKRTQKITRLLSLSFALVLLGACTKGNEAAKPQTTTEARPQKEALLADARPEFKTRLIDDTWEPAGPADVPPKHVEVDDLHAARAYLASLPYIDRERIYVAGHSRGGTMALLANQSKEGFRAAFSLGGIPDLELRLAAGKTSVGPPFDLQDPKELHLRSPMRFMSSLNRR